MAEKHFLKTIFNEQNFKKEDLELVLNQYQRIEFSKHDFLISENTTANFYYFMESGYARAYVIDLEGNDISTNFSVQQTS